MRSELNGRWDLNSCINVLSPLFPVNVNDNVFWRESCWPWPLSPDDNCFIHPTKPTLRDPPRWTLKDFSFLWKTCKGFAHQNISFIDALLIFSVVPIHCGVSQKVSNFINLVSHSFWCNNRMIPLKFNFKSKHQLRLPIPFNSPRLNWF